MKIHNLTIRCDACEVVRCPAQKEQLEFDDVMQYTPDELDVLIRDEGWSIDGEIHRCPHHTKAQDKIDMESVMEHYGRD